MHLLVERLGLDREINDRLDLLKVHLPYRESDHVLNIAYNVLAGGTRLEHLEFLRNDEGYLDALGARRIPDPTTAGDFCRRFDAGIRLVKEYVADFRHQPLKCGREYRIVVLWKDLAVHEGQRKPFDDSRCFFVITNEFRKSAAEIVLEANHRCNQENLFARLKSDMHALSAPVDRLVSNWAYMVMASPAWSLKAWMALSLPIGGRNPEARDDEPKMLLRMKFSTFRRAFMAIPTQIVRSSRRIVFSVLAWNRWLAAFFRLLDRLQVPIRPDAENLTAAAWRSRCARTSRPGFGPAGGSTFACLRSRAPPRWQASLSRSRTAYAVTLPASGSPVASAMGASGGLGGMRSRMPRGVATSRPGSAGPIRAG
ncbi:MAG: hypothetical protein ACKOC8_00265 [Pirellulales bacterium]